MMSFSISDLTSRILNDKKPVILLDTCSLLDIVRAPDRDNIIPDIISSAIEFTSNIDVWLVASEIVDSEWNDNIDVVCLNSKNAIKNLHKKAQLFKGALDHSPISDKWHYDKLFISYNLENELMSLSKKLLGQLKFIKNDNECLARASLRVVKTIAPASKGKDEYKDCMIIEHYLKLCKNLRDSEFSEKIIFVSSNRTDFGTPYKIKSPLGNEFKEVLLNYVSNLNEAKQEMV